MMSFSDIFNGGTSAGLLDGAWYAIELLVVFIAIFGDTIGVLVAESILFSFVYFHGLCDILESKRVFFVHHS